LAKSPAAHARGLRADFILPFCRNRKAKEWRADRPGEGMLRDKAQRIATIPAHRGHESNRRTIHPAGTTAAGMSRVTAYRAEPWDAQFNQPSLAGAGYLAAIVNTDATTATYYAQSRNSGHRITPSGQPPQGHLSGSRQGGLVEIALLSAEK
jgi:hypothetical protein